MKDFGQTLWDDKIQKWGYNVVYDCWGVPGGLLRGLFEYTYTDDQLRIRPHLPETITRYIQKHPVRFGRTRIYLTVHGTGQPRLAKANEAICEITEEGWIILKPDPESENLSVEIVCGEGEEGGAWQPTKKPDSNPPQDPEFWEIDGFVSPLYPHIEPQTVNKFYKAMLKAGLEETYECAMSRLVMDHLIAGYHRKKKLEAGTLVIPQLAGTPPALEKDISKGYISQARYLTGGLVDHLRGMSYWNEAVDPEIMKIALKTGLIIQNNE
jgi:hypothetical protein